MRIYEKGSDLLFGEFDEDYCFHIEDSNLYKKLANKNIKSVEFLLYSPKSNALLFIEGKRTLSKVNNIDHFNENIKDIVQKFRDSFQLASSIWFGKHNCEVELPRKYSDFFQKERKFVLVLVIKERPARELRFIQERLKYDMKKDIRLWNFEIIALNEEMAKKHRMIVNCLNE